MKLRTRLSVTFLEDRSNPSGLDDGTGYMPPPYDPGAPPAQAPPIPPAPIPPGPTPLIPPLPPYGP